ncbi:hypothetical protein [Tenacibaculum jejuense]|uniref:Lipoprotein n=1 Tax=Tenacibaculum jejuense TaxID=584609 RepID=A0A238U5D2_9FLAO|nr:hypothetical protein [Tenacibaculum jejuense]SNR14216.1 Protein of unknown function precursor [Tenacibaculum jejuense]
MKKRLFCICIKLIFISSSFSQDIIDNGDLSSVKEFKNDLNEKFSFGNSYTQLKNENIETFVKRILGDKINLHHGAFKLKDFQNCIVAFASYTYEETPIVIGFLLKPTDTKQEYKLLKILELSSGCGNEPEVKSVFLHNTDTNSVGKELVIHTSDNCGKHGKKNYVFVYNGLIKNNKLILQNFLFEHCDYSQVRIGEEWDYDMGEKDVDERKYYKCIYLDFKTIRKSLDATKKH